MARGRYLPAIRDIICAHRPFAARPPRRRLPARIPPHRRFLQKSRLLLIIYNRAMLLLLLRLLLLLLLLLLALPSRVLGGKHVVEPLGSAPIPLSRSVPSVVAANVTADAIRHTSHLIAPLSHLASRISHAYLIAHHTHTPHTPHTFHSLIKRVIIGTAFSLALSRARSSQSYSSAWLSVSRVQLLPVQLRRRRRFVAAALRRGGLRRRRARLGAANPALRHEQLRRAPHAGLFL